MIRIDDIVGAAASVALVTAGMLINRYCRRRLAADDVGFVDVPIMKWLGVRGGLALAVIGGIVAIAVAFPPSVEYHFWQEKAGTVVAVQPRLIAEGQGSTQNFAVELAGDGVYRCDDSRCSLLKPGDRVTFRCLREWQYASTPGWVCRFVDAVR